MNTIEPVVWVKEEIPAEKQKELDNLLQRVFQGEDGGYTWAWDEKYTVTLSVDGKIVSSLGIFDRMAKVNGQPVRLGGIGGVATDPDHRRNGYAGQVLEKAAKWMTEKMRVDFGLLVCSTERARYYAKFGWQVVEGPLWVDQPQGKVILKAVTMILPCKKTDWPDGEIDLCGLPW